MPEDKLDLRQSLDSFKNRSLSKEKAQKHRLLQTKASLLNDRVEKIKNKYGTQEDLKQSFLDYQSSFYSTVDENKENQSSYLNCSLDRS